MGPTARARLRASQAARAGAALIIPTSNMLRSWVLRRQLLVQALVRSKQIVKELEDVKISVRPCRGR